MTETSPVSTQTRIHYSLDRRVSTVGTFAATRPPVDERDAARRQRTAPDVSQKRCEHHDRPKRGADRDKAAVIGRLGTGARPRTGVVLFVVRYGGYCGGARRASHHRAAEVMR